MQHIHDDEVIFVQLAIGGPLLAHSGHDDYAAECPLSGVERTKIGSKLHLRLWHNDLLKFCARNGSGKKRWGKHRGKQFGGCPLGR